MGTLGMLRSAAEAEVRTFVYASCSSVYGDVPRPLRIEPELGRPLSPYAASKKAAEAFAESYASLGKMSVVGLRYFNVYGTRQNAAGPYSAIIPRWIAQLAGGERPDIYGSGHQARDFTHVSDVVNANLLVAATSFAAPMSLNVATGTMTTVRELFELLRDIIADGRPITPAYRPVRGGDVLSAVASLDLCREKLGYAPRVTLADGLRQVVPWHLAQAG